MKVQTAFNIQ